MNKILLVEDNQINSEMLAEFLQRKGFDVLVAFNGQEAIDKAKSMLPDLILMDMSIPIIDGWHVSKELKAHHQTCNIPIIALTAHAMTGDREKALEAGCDDYDTKPIEFPRLLGKIYKFLGNNGIQLPH